MRIEETFNSACILTCSVETNCPHGGDAGHGGRTTIEFIDEGSTSMSVDGEDRQGEKISLTFSGDCEAEVLCDALFFAAKELRRQLDRNQVLDENRIPR